MALLDNIAVFYNMTEASGNASDSVGSNHLTDNGGVGNAGGFRDFERDSSQYLSLADNATVSTGDIDFSMQAWIKLESAVDCIIIGKDVNSPANSRDYTLDISSGAARFYLNGSGAGLVNTGAVISPGETHYIAAGHVAGSDVLWISLDGDTPLTGSTGGVAPDESGAEFRVGARAYSGFEGYFDGLIYRVGLWKRDIRSDLSTLYNGGAGLDYAGMGGGAAARFILGTH